MNLLLNNTQYDILTHRLEVGDAIAEALADNEGQPMFTADEFSNMADWLLAHMEKTRRIELNIEPFASHLLLAQMVLAEAINGSVFYSCAEAECRPLQTANVGRSGDSLARRLATAFNMEVEFPHY